MPPKAKKKKEPKYKQRTVIVGANTVQAVCSCGWTGDKFAAVTSTLSDIMESANRQIQSHKVHKEQT